MTPEDLAELRARAEAAPDDIDALLAAAYGCDRWGTEEDAVVYYDRAWARRDRIEAGALPGFLLGYGSTLRNVRRFHDSLEVLEHATAAYPQDRALQAFLALTQLDSGSPDHAVATLIDALLSLAPGAPDLAAYERALAFYRDELRSR